MELNLINTFTDELPADPELENSRRQVFGACYSVVEPKKTSAAKLIALPSPNCPAQLPN